MDILLSELQTIKSDYFLNSSQSHFGVSKYYYSELIHYENVRERDLCETNPTLETYNANNSSVQVITTSTQNTKGKASYRR